ncbi:MAG TPA: hypothetical protein VME70_15780 [Mycobacteriales bacterium]|nr:hypothetical protein [Mycobacteriales bacterium]
MLNTLLAGRGKARRGIAPAVAPMASADPAGLTDADRDAYIWLVNQAVEAGRDDVVTELSRSCEPQACVAVAG